MVIFLAILAGAGGLATLWWGAKLAAVAAEPNSGLAVFAMLGPFGASLTFTVICMAGAGVIHAVEQVRREVRMWGEAQAGLLHARLPQPAPVPRPVASPVRAAGSWDSSTPLSMREKEDAARREVQRREAAARSGNGSEFDMPAWMRAEEERAQRNAERRDPK